MKIEQKTIDWKKDNAPVHYDDAIQFMQNRIREIYLGIQPECIWMLEHPPIYTAGTSAKPEHLINAQNIPIQYTGRGGEWTYHGPGQRIIYIMLDLNQRGQDIRLLVRNIEQWIINTLESLNIHTHRRQGYPGIWIGKEKIAAIGIRLTKWISWHGVSINYNPNLDAYKNIIPCGITDGTTTAISKVNPKITMDELDQALRSTFTETFHNRF